MLRAKIVLDPRHLYFRVGAFLSLTNQAKCDRPMAEMFDKPLVTRQTVCYCIFVVKGKIMEKPEKYKFNEYGKFIYVRFVLPK